MTDHLLGLRIDIDTHEGMRDGVPRLLKILADAKVRATFYFSMGPDRSGLALLNALRPGFLSKMRRTHAARLYGWRTLLSGILLPARPIGAAFPEIVRAARGQGHETGVHAWDHRAWQDRLPRFTPARVRAELDRGYRAYRAALGRPPITFAAPAWLVSDEALLQEETYDLLFASDCRGVEPFVPIVRGRTLETPQVPATLPTLDEALGTTCTGAADFFERVLEESIRQTWPVMTIHAEMEGGPFAAEFAAFLENARRRGLRCLPLGQLLKERLRTGPLPVGRLRPGRLVGRHGVVSMQSTAVTLRPDPSTVDRSTGCV